MDLFIINLHIAQSILPFNQLLKLACLCNIIVDHDDAGARIKGLRVQCSM